MVVGAGGPSNGVRFSNLGARLYTQTSIRVRILDTSTQLGVSTKAFYSATHTYQNEGLASDSSNPRSRPWQLHGLPPRDDHIQQ